MLKTVGLRVGGGPSQFGSTKGWFAKCHPPMVLIWAMSLRSSCHDAASARVVGGRPLPPMAQRSVASSDEDRYVSAMAAIN